MTAQSKLIWPNCELIQLSAIDAYAHSAAGYEVRPVFEDVNEGVCCPRLTRTTIFQPEGVKTSYPGHTAPCSAITCFVDPDGTRRG